MLMGVLSLANKLSITDGTEMRETSSLSFGGDMVGDTDSERIGEGKERTEQL